MRRFRHTIDPQALLLGLMLLITTCADIGHANAAKTAPSTASDNSTITVTQKDSGKIITVPKGTDVVIELEANVTTGFAWSVTSVVGASAKQNGNASYVTQGSAIPGRGGIFSARFKTIKSGKTTVSMQYRRPWEKGVAAAQTFNVTITVVSPADTSKKQNS